MKKLCPITMIAVCMLIISNALQSQTPQTTLDQVELIKQLLGIWKCEIAQDTIEYSELKPYGTGVYADFKYVAKDKVFLEGKQLYGYDKKMGKFVVSVLVKGMDIQLAAMWFISEKICVVYNYRDISNLENATFKIEVEFKSPDIMLYKTIVNNNIISTYTYVRVQG
jgi:hypothetical protein